MSRPRRRDFGVRNALANLIQRRATRKAEAIACGQAHQHPYSPRSGMVELHLRKEDQLAVAVGLAKKSYDYVRRIAASS